LPLSKALGVSLGWVIMDKFLTCYDYGTGGIWRFIIAESALQILTKYPELEIADSIPEWMTQEVIQRMNEIVINIEDNNNEFLNAIIAERNKI
jgi:hypothetical protein